MSKNIVITGANRGIGLALTKAFKHRGDNVYALCRSSNEQLAALSVHVITNIDVASDIGIKNMTKALSGIGIDILICNAGILRDESLGEMSIASIREQFEVNALAPIRVVDKLQANLNPDGKVAMITSRMGSIGDNDSGGYYGYRMSKAALNAGAVSLSRDLAKYDIAVGLYHPGYVQTDMVNHGGDISADESAARLLDLISNLSMKDTGVFRHSNGEVLPW